MNEYPDTHDSLLAQVRDPANRDAWDRFIELYHPVILRTALAKGFQEADAHDLAQQVLMAVAKAIGNWEKQSPSSRFRHWLSRVTRNAILNAMMRRPHDRATGGSSVENLLDEVVDRDGETTSLLESEYRRELYLRGAEIVKNEFRIETWQAFERSVSGEESIEAIASSLGKSVGAIYTARSRVMYRLREVIANLEGDWK